MKVLHGRHTRFRPVLARIGAVKRQGVNTTKLVAGIGPSRMCFGTEVAGMSDTHLATVRATTASAAAPATAGKQVDAVLYLLDAGRGGKVDPAFAAHAQPIVTWALAGWQGWLHPGDLSRAASWAEQRVCEDGRVKWAVVAGPSGGLVGSLVRLGWQ